MQAWAQRTREVRSLWLTGSFATGTADRFSDIDLRACIASEQFDYFTSVVEALSCLDNWDVFKRRTFTEDREDSEMVVDFADGLCLDLHVVTPERLTAAYVGPYPISVLIDEGCDLAGLHAAAKREHEAREPADQKTRISRAVSAWSFLAHALAYAVRGNSAHALSLLEGSRVALAQVLAGQDEPIPDRFSPAFLPKATSPEHRKIIDATVPHQAAAAIPDTIFALAAALRAACTDLERADATGRLPRIRNSTEAMIRRELRTSDGR
jgi:hypothetical protein